MSQFNLSKKSLEERQRIDVDLAASGVACKERLNLPVIVSDIEKVQPVELHDYFRERLKFYRLKSKDFPPGQSPIYMKDKK
ncbi:MAG: DNA polymerase III subunit theta [Enterobacterales bacterium endosymbiont of Blomia tropicalis]|uniref:DNA polymerase III subunit theta n=1 Tax=Mixta mediterraneensis TaxID=2758443 RepID=UPI0025A72DF8|nr:DNA polymerase III subunit theta [Mixta mediterraneensis]MDL4916254.1 DNA polymerase III subunit theta [Mixta mediterraneensis]